MKKPRRRKAKGEGRKPGRDPKAAGKSAPVDELVHVDAIHALTGIDEPALRRLAAKGIVPRGKVSKWPLKETVRKLFDHMAALSRVAATGLPIFDSMEACEGAGLLTKKFLQDLKGFGLPGFNNTRVDFNLLIPALEDFLAGTGGSQHELKGEAVATWSEMRQKYQARLSKIDFEEARGEVISKGTAVDTVRQLQVIHHHSYGRMIEEWPSTLAGQNAAKIRIHIEKYVNGLKASEEASINGLEKTKGKRRAG